MSDHLLSLSKLAAVVLMQIYVSSMGYLSLKTKQQELNFLKGCDVFVSLPTGYGKLLVFAILPSLFHLVIRRIELSIVIVVSPLAALILEKMSAFSRMSFMYKFLAICNQMKESTEESSIVTTNWSF